MENYKYYIFFVSVFFLFLFYSVSSEKEIKGWDGVKFRGIKLYSVKWQKDSPTVESKLVARYMFRNKKEKFLYLEHATLYTTNAVIISKKATYETWKKEWKFIDFKYREASEELYSKIGNFKTRLNRFYGSKKVIYRSPTTEVKSKNVLIYTRIREFEFKNSVEIEVKVNNET